MRITMPEPKSRQQHQRRHELNCVFARQHTTLVSNGFSGCQFKSLPRVDMQYFWALSDHNTRHNFEAARLNKTQQLQTQMQELQLQYKFAFVGEAAR